MSIAVELLPPMMLVKGFVVVAVVVVGFPRMEGRCARALNPVM